MTTAWLLPVVTLVVGSSSGGVLVPALQVYSPSYALLTATFSACMVTIGLTLSLMLLTIYILRLVVYGYPTGASILSVFLPVGPCGQAAYSLLKLGSSFRSLLPLNYGDAGGLLRQSGTGEAVEVICVVGAMVLWSLASMWIIFAMLGLGYTLRRERIEFRLSFWGTVFPNVRIYGFLMAQDALNPTFHRECTQISTWPWRQRFRRRSFVCGVRYIRWGP